MANNSAAEVIVSYSGPQSYPTRIARHAALIVFGRMVVPLIVDLVLSGAYRSAIGSVTLGPT